MYSSSIDPLIMSGIGASPGIAIGKVCVLKKREAVLTGIDLTHDKARSDELAKFKKSVQLAVDELESIQGSLNLNKVDIDILDTQIQFLTDPQIESDVTDKIYTENKTANDAVIEVTASAVEMFKNLDDDYLKARAADIQDVGNRILKHLNASDSKGRKEYTENTILLEKMKP